MYRRLKRKRKKRKRYTNLDKFRLTVVSPGPLADVDECRGDPSVCRPRQLCENTEGSYRCLAACRLGYEWREETGTCEGTAPTHIKHTPPPSRFPLHGWTRARVRVWLAPPPPLHTTKPHLHPSPLARTNERTHARTHTRALMQLCLIISFGGCCLRRYRAEPGCE